eukprot:SAG31_NODE_2277_length_6027_cov_4.019062_5_plen_75_part_00
MAEHRVRCEGLTHVNFNCYHNGGHVPTWVVGIIICRQGFVTEATGAIGFTISWLPPHRHATFRPHDIVHGTHKG